METGEVLIVNHGLTGSHIKKEDNLTLQYRGIPEIRKWYSAVILRWCGYACVSRKGNKKENFIVSKDINNVIESLQKKLLRLKPEGSGEVPIIINSNPIISDIPTIHEPGANFVARRILSGHDDSNQRRIALVRHKIAVSKTVMDYIQYYRRKYPQLEIALHDRASFLDSLEKETNDIIFLPERSKWTYAIHEGSLREKQLEDENSIDFDADFSFRQRKRKQKASDRLLFSEESELGEMGLKTILETCESQKTLRCGTIWTDGYDGLSRDTLEGIIWQCHLDLDIPGFLDKCPKV